MNLKLFVKMKEKELQTRDFRDIEAMGLKGHRGNKYIAYQWDFGDIEATNI
jgi:hypothetical protein